MKLSGAAAAAAARREARLAEAAREERTLERAYDLDSEDAPEDAPEMEGTREPERERARTVPHATSGAAGSRLGEGGTLESGAGAGAGAGGGVTSDVLLLLQEIRRRDDENRRLAEQLREQEQKAKSAGEDEERGDDLNSGRRYRDDDRVTLLHGWGRVEPTRRDFKFGKSRTMYECVGGVVRDMLYGDALFIQQQWGKRFVKILPPEATEADFARATGIQPMNLSRLAAMNELVDADALVEAWGEERALVFAEKLTTTVAARNGGVLPRTPARR